MNDEKLYTPEEIANILKLSKYTIYEMVKRGELPAYRIGRSIRISDSQIQSFMSNIKNKENVYDAEIVIEKGSKYAVINDKVKISVSTKLNGNAKVSIRPEDIILSEIFWVSSARNVHKGTVTDIIVEDNNAMVVIDIGISLIALITKDSMIEMNIKKGDQLYAIFKTMAVEVFK